MNVSIALDQAIGRRRADKLKAWGYNIVCVADQGEEDGKWLNRAFASGALFVVSPDMDIPKLIEIEKYPMVWINYPSDDESYRDKLAEYIDSTIKFKVGFLKNVIKAVEPKKATIIKAGFKPKQSFMSKLIKRIGL